MPVNDGAVVDMETDSLGNSDPFAVSAKANEVRRRVEMLHPLDLLLNDRAGIEVGCDVVAGGSDQFHSPLVGLLVGIGSDEGRQEAVVDVDDTPCVIAAEIIRKDLHEAGKHDEFDILLLDQGADFGKARKSVLPIHLNFVKRNACVLRNAETVRAIADDGGDFDRQLTEFRPPKDFIEAVIGFSDENCGPHPIGQSAEMPIRLQGAAKRPKAIHEIFHVHIEVAGLNLKAGKEFPSKLIRELVEFDQIAAVACDVVGNLGDDAWLVRTTEFEDQS